MLFVLNAASLPSLLDSVSSCLEKLLPDAIQVLACPSNSEKCESGQQQQQQGRTVKGGRSAAKAKGELVSDERDGAVSSQCTAAAALSRYF